MEGRKPWRIEQACTVKARRSAPNLCVAFVMPCVTGAVDCVLQLWGGLKGTQGGSAPSLTPETHSPAKVKFQKGEDQD